MWRDLEDWLALKAKNTQVQYRAVLREFCEVLGIEKTEEGFGLLCKSVPIDATRFLNWVKLQPSKGARCKLVSDTVSLDTVKRKATVMSSIFEELVNEGHVTVNPFVKSKRELRKVRGNDRRPHQLIPFDKVKQLFALDWVGPKGRTDKAILACLFGGALRRSEVTSLRILDVKRTTKGNVYLTLRNTKRQRQEVQALPEWAGEIVSEHARMRREEERARDADPLFTMHSPAGVATKEPIQDKVIYSRFRRALARVGLTGDYSPHCARATAITALLEQGLTHRSVQTFSRHSSVQMVSHYDKMRDFEGEDVAVQLQYGKKGIGNL